LKIQDPYRGVRGQEGREERRMFQGRITVGEGGG